MSLHLYQLSCSLCLLCLVWAGTATAQQQDTVFQCHLTEETPQFPGGPAALMRYISAHLKYPEKNEDNSCSRIVAGFVVARSGKIRQVRILRGCGMPAFEKEAIRLIENMPLWKPGKRNGIAVDCHYTLPVLICRPDD